MMQTQWIMWKPNIGSPTWIGEQIPDKYIDRLIWTSEKPLSDPSFLSQKTRDDFLVNAVAYRNLAAVVAALKAGAVPQAWQIESACKAGNVPIVTQLLTHNPMMVNARDPWTQTPLHIASRLGNPDLVRAILAQGPEVNAVDTYGETPLDKARNSRSDECQQLLLDAGA